VKASTKKRAKKRAAAKPVGAGRPKGKRQSKTLRAAVVEILGKSGKAMRAAEIAKELANTGYESKSKDVKNVVSVLLPQSKEFRRVRKGLYALKK